MNDRKGMHYIAHLLARPSEVIDCTTLRAHIDGISAPRPPDEVLEEVVQLIASGEMSESRASDLGPQIDRKGIQGINVRVRQIERDELPAATGGGKLGLEDELKQLKITLSSGVGIGGRSRRMASKAEADRKHVSSRYHQALRAAEEAKMCALTTHLKSNLTVGASCSYSPETEISWFT